MMLDVQMIGEKAGKVWQYLDKHRDASRAELKRALGLTDLEVGTAPKLSASIKKHLYSHKQRRYQHCLSDSGVGRRVAGGSPFTKGRLLVIPFLSAPTLILTYKVTH